MPADALTYREYHPPASLAGVVDCFWRREHWTPPHDDLGVLPDGRVDLVWAADGDVRVMGPQRRALKASFSPRVALVGVRFAPGIGPALLGVPGHAIADTHPPLAVLDSRAAITLMRDVAAIEHVSEAPIVMTRAIERRMSTPWSPDPLVTRASALLAMPGARVEHVAAELGLSRRELERRFTRLVGHGPKTLQRILRFQRLMYALGMRHDGGLARIAPALGYADQPHLTRETRALSGLSPGQLGRVLDALTRSGARGIFKTGTAAPASRQRRGLYASVSRAERGDSSGTPG